MRQKAMSKRRIFLILCFSVILAACSPSIAPTQPSVVPISASGALPTIAPPDSSAYTPSGLPTAAPLNPLTGMPPADPTNLERRPVLVKISNFPRLGRPHAGLSAADIVFDYFIGSGTNRFIAVYYGQNADVIGPVRSGRLVDIQLTGFYGGLLAFGGAEQDTVEEIYESLGNRAFSHLEAGEPAFNGTDTHSVIGVFANSAEITKYAIGAGIDNTRPALDGMLFEARPPAAGKPGTQLTVLFNYYNRAVWVYDQASGTYLRWIEDMKDEDTVYNMVPLVDRNNGKQLAFSNVVVLFAKYTEIKPAKHQIDLVGERGRAMLFRDGQSFEARWSALRADAPIQFTDTSGASLAFKPGNTWVVLAGLNSSFDQKNTGEWGMVFMLP